MLKESFLLRIEVEREREILSRRLKEAVVKRASKGERDRERIRGGGGEARDESRHVVDKPRTRPKYKASESFQALKREAARGGNRE